MDRSMDSYMVITQDTKEKTRNLDLGGGLKSGDGVISVMASPFPSSVEEALFLEEEE